MKVKFILPALMEAQNPGYRTMKYSLFPPLGLATLAGFLSAGDECEIQDEHVEKLNLFDEPDFVAIETYITNARRAYEIADTYRARGTFVILGGLHATSLPGEALRHADAVFAGPAEESFPRFLGDFRNGTPGRLYFSKRRSLDDLPSARRDLIKRHLYLAPNSLVVSRGCPHRCSFCYKNDFFRGGVSFYTQRVDRALAEIESLPGRHLFFLDDHLLADPFFASRLFDGMSGMGKVFQGAATIDSVLRGNLIEKAARAGLRSVFIGFESLSSTALKEAGKLHNDLGGYREAVEKLHGLGVMINGSFVFGLDGDDAGVFPPTVDWALERGLATATFHILTPYPGTPLFSGMWKAGRIRSLDWDLYDTRHAVFEPDGMTREELESGYRWAYRHFYRWSSILKGGLAHDSAGMALKRIACTATWKKFEPLWDMIIGMGLLRYAQPLMEKFLASTGGHAREKSPVAEVAEATETDIFESVR